MQRSWITESPIARAASASYTAYRDGPYLTAAGMHWYIEHYLSGDEGARDDPRVSPLLAGDDRLAHSPRTLVITAELDPLLDEGEAYGDRLRAAGVETTVTRYEGMFHGFIWYADFIDGAFRHVLDDITPNREAKRIVLASGKIAFDAMHMRKAQDIRDVAILRLEQLYPFPGNELAVAFSLYPQATEIRWLQEEPLNMGAWASVASLLPSRLPQGVRLTCTGRAPNGSPATGSMTVHTAG